MRETSIHPKQLLAPRGLRPKSSFGQNFLSDDHQLLGIARAILESRPNPEAPVVELGPGTGALTGVLLDAGATVHAVERDRDLVPVLRERFAAHIASGRLHLYEDNALTFDYAPITVGHGVLCGNLPYHLTSSLVLRAVELVTALQGVVFLVQLEVAERLAAEPGNKDWGILSVLLQHVYDVELFQKVPKGAFWPVPEVDGGVVRMMPHPSPRGGRVALASLKHVVKTAFQQRRKTLKNTLASLGGAALLREADIDPTLRAERVDVEGFVRLARAVEARQAREASGA